MDHRLHLNRHVIVNDLTQPGAIDQLLAFHRAVFGDARMETAGGGADGGDGGGTGGEGGQGGTGAGDGGQGEGQQAEQQKVEDLPDWAQKLIRDTRNDAATRRANADQQAQQAAEQAKTELAQTIGKALGLIKDGDGNVDPAKLQTQLGDITTAHTNLQREHQVLLAALDAGADHKALLDSRTFLAKVGELDPTADDFAAKVTAEVTSAIKDNPKLKAARAAGTSSADHAGGSGEDSDPASRAMPGQSRIAAAYATSGK